jgi:hypothetical protein
MKEFKINPFNVVGNRRVECLLPQMSIVYLDNDLYIRSDFLSWIENNLKGRYWHGTLVKLVDNRTAICAAIAFEDPYESTLFLLGCPNVAKSKV